METKCRHCVDGRLQMPVKTNDGKMKQLWVTCPHCQGKSKGFATK